MPRFVSVAQGKGSDVIVTVSAAFAQAQHLQVVDQPAVDRHGKPLSPRARIPKTSAKSAASTTPTHGGVAASKPEEASK